MGMIAWRSTCSCSANQSSLCFRNHRLWYGHARSSTIAPSLPVCLCSKQGLCATVWRVLPSPSAGCTLTDGGDQSSSRTLGPVLAGSPSDFYRSNLFNRSELDASVMAWHRQQVFVAVPTGGSDTNDELLVYDPRYSGGRCGLCLVLDLASFPADGRPELFFSLATGSNHWSPVAVVFAGQRSPIAARWRSGWLDLDDPNVKSLKSRRCGKEQRVGFVYEGLRVLDATEARFVWSRRGSVELMALTRAMWGDGS